MVPASFAIITTKFKKNDPSFFKLTHYLAHTIAKYNKNITPKNINIAYKYLFCTHPNLKIIKLTIVNSL